MWRKTRKRKSLILSFIEKARFRRTGAIFPRFSDKRSQVRSEHEVWVTHAGRSTKKEGQNQLYPVPTPIVQAIFSPDTGEDYNKHGFMSRQHFFLKKWRLRVNICFSASETYKKEISLNVDKSIQLFLCFQMRMWTNFANLVRLLPPEDKSHKWHLSHPIVYSCCCYFF